jgi:hypothetical protein
MVDGFVLNLGIARRTHILLRHQLQTTTMMSLSTGSPMMDYKNGKV